MLAEPGRDMPPSLLGEPATTGDAEPDAMNGLDGDAKPDAMNGLDGEDSREPMCGRERAGEFEATKQRGDVERSSVISPPPSPMPGSGRDGENERRSCGSAMPGSGRDGEPSHNSLTSPRGAASPADGIMWRRCAADVLCHGMMWAWQSLRSDVCMAKP